MTAKPQNAHIAKLIQDFLANNKISMTELARRLNRPRNWTSHHGWRNGTSAPAAMFRPVLAQILGVSEDALLPKGGGDRYFRSREKTLCNGSAIDTLEQQLAEAQPAGAARILPSVKAIEVLSYTVDSKGQASLRVAVKGPHAHMMKLFRVLLDAGLAPGGEEAARDQQT